MSGQQLLQPPSGAPPNVLRRGRRRGEEEEGEEEKEEGEEEMEEGEEGKQEGEKEEGREGGGEEEEGEEEKEKKGRGRRGRRRNRRGRRNKNQREDRRRSGGFPEGGLCLCSAALIRSIMPSCNPQEPPRELSSRPISPREAEAQGAQEPAEAPRYQWSCWDANSTHPTRRSIHVDLDRLKGSRGRGSGPLQKALKAWGARLEARPGVRYLRCSGEAVWH